MQKHLFNHIDIPKENGNTLNGNAKDLDLFWVNRRILDLDGFAAAN